VSGTIFGHTSTNVGRAAGRDRLLRHQRRVKEAGLEDFHSRAAAMRLVTTAISSEYGTYKTVKASFWPWLTGKVLETF